MNLKQFAGQLHHQQLNQIIAERIRLAQGGIAKLNFPYHKLTHRLSLAKH
jgi:hypothetical protein